jgi:hypothetical protein
MASLRWVRWSLLVTRKYQSAYSGCSSPASTHAGPSARCRRNFSTSLLGGERNDRALLDVRRLTHSVCMPHCWLTTATLFRYLSLLGRRRPSTTATEVAGGAGAPRCRPFASSDETTGGAAASEPGGSGPLPVEKLADET